MHNKRSQLVHPIFWPPACSGRLPDNVLEEASVFLSRRWTCARGSAKDQMAKLGSLIFIVPIHVQDPLADTTVNNLISTLRRQKGPLEENRHTSVQIRIMRIVMLWMRTLLKFTLGLVPALFNWLPFRGTSFSNLILFPFMYNSCSLFKGIFPCLPFCCPMEVDNCGSSVKSVLPESHGGTRHLYILFGCRLSWLELNNIAISVSWNLGTRMMRGSVCCMHFTWL